ncbi:MAG: NAD(P)-dependent oxidoreductase [Chthoniobacteraceae bacterium]
MNIAILGATGREGHLVVEELLQRGHAVTGIARHPEKLAPKPGLSLEVGDVKDKARLVELFRGHDAVVHSVMFLASDVRNVIEAVKEAGVPRLVVVGGAGSLEVAPGIELVDTPEFPAPYKAESLAGRAFLEILRTEKDLDWTFISPSAFFDPDGARTGKFRLGGDRLLATASGESRISMADFAIALVDELEHPAHPRARFTVGY